MKPGIPWSVKGIEQEAREAAKDAARRSGMTLGEWLSSMILESAGGEDDLDRRYGGQKLQERPAAPAGGSRGPVHGRLDQLARQLTALADLEAPSAGAVAQSAAPDEEALLQRIMERIEAHRHRAATTGSIEPRLEPIHPAALPRRRATVRVEDASAPAIELALRHVVDRIEVSETRTCEAIRALEDRLPDLTARVREAQAKQPPHEAHQQVQAELARIAREIERVRQSGAEAAENAKSAAIDAVRHEVRQAEKSLRAVIAEAQRTSCSSAELADALSRFRPDVDDLKQRFNEHVSETNADREAVAAVERHVGRLADRLAGIEQRLSELAAMERAVADLTRRLEESLSSSQAAGDTAAQMPGVPAELKALEAGLESIRANAALTDERTKEAFEAVHRALDHILGKLRELEADKSRRALAASTAWGGAAPCPQQETVLEDFIAAARRAVHSEGSGISTPGPTSMKPSEAGGIRRWSLFRRMRGGAAFSSSRTGSDAGRRNRLLFAALVLLAALAAVPANRLPDGETRPEPDRAPTAAIWPVDITPKAAPRALQRQTDAKSLIAQTNSW